MIVRKTVVIETATMDVCNGNGLRQKLVARLMPGRR
jgi:hypothetical protein